MKLSKEMVEAMGGVNSDNYQEFKKLCYTAFLHLRRSVSVRFVRRENLQLVIREIDTSIGHKSENVIVT